MTCNPVALCLSVRLRAFRPKLGLSSGWDSKFLLKRSSVLRAQWVMRSMAAPLLFPISAPNQCMTVAAKNDSDWPVEMVVLTARQDEGHEGGVLKPGEPF